jgi:hypothetical protein
MVTVSLKAVDGSNHPTGVDLCIATFNGNELPFLGSGNANWYWISFTTAPCAQFGSSICHCGEMRTSGLYWRSDNTSPTYAGGNREYSNQCRNLAGLRQLAKSIVSSWLYLDDRTMLPATLALEMLTIGATTCLFERVLHDC